MRVPKYFVAFIALSIGQVIGQTLVPAKLWAQALAVEKNANDQPEIPLKWAAPFSRLSGPFAKHTLVVQVFTNDPPHDNENPTGVGAVWCQSLIESSVRRAITQRADLKKRIILQRIAVGTPSQLTGGQNRNRPARAMIAVCDTGYKLLDLRIGVPDDVEFVSLIEDAETADAFLQTLADSGPQAVHAIAEYKAKNMLRVWRESLQQMLVGAADLDDQGKAGLNAQITPARLVDIGEHYEAVYLADVKSRFSLSQASDHLRLAILEQHIEARLPWCDAILPFLAGREFKPMWRTLLEVVWKRAPVTMDDESSDGLIQWWDSESKNGLVIFGLDPPALDRRQKWPPFKVGEQTRRKVVSWDDFHEAVVSRKYRLIETQELATLFRKRDLGTIDIQRPGRARYVLFDPKRKLPHVIRESDLPAKFIRMVK